MTNTYTMALLGRQARRIEPETCAEIATKADRERAALECTTFLDRCAEQATREGWFGITYYHCAPMTERVLDSLRICGPQTAVQLMDSLSRSRSPIDRTLRDLLADGRIVVMGAQHTKGGPRIYGLPAVSDDAQ